jgi:hypothetical protein
MITDVLIRARIPYLDPHKHVAKARELGVLLAT